MPEHDLIVIGAGPGGYVAAIRAAQLGLNVGCVDKEPVLGGTCLRIGCIPSKALLEASEKWVEVAELKQHGIRVGKPELDLPAMMKRKQEVVAGLTKGVEALFRKHRITRYRGHARLTGPGRVTVQTDAGEQSLNAKHIVLATGSAPTPLPGITIDHQRVVTSTEALAFEAVPQSLVVIGAGYIGLELGTVWQRLGADVTVLEYLDRILPGMDAELAAEALKQFTRQGLKFRLKTKVTGVTVEADGCSVQIDGAEPVRGERVMVAVGRKPCVADLGLDTVGVDLDGAGHIAVNDHFATSAPGVYAIGDLIRGPMLAHKAEEEGVAVAEVIATGSGHVDYTAIPGVVYTHPEVAAVGGTEESIQGAGIPYRKGLFHFRGNGRARSIGRTEGFVKILAHAETDRVLGVHIIGARAGDLIAEAATAMAFGASSEDIARVCHAHPTLAEAIKEAALAVHGRAIHA